MWNVNERSENFSSIIYLLLTLGGKKRANVVWVCMMLKWKIRNRFLICARGFLSSFVAFVSVPMRTQKTDVFPPHETNRDINTYNVCLIFIWIFFLVHWCIKLAFSFFIFIPFLRCFHRILIVCSFCLPLFLFALEMHIALSLFISVCDTKAFLFVWKQKK